MSRRVMMGLALTVVLLVIPQATSRADIYPTYANDGLHSIGLTGGSAVVVDETTSQVFVSNGTALAVTDLTGAVTSMKTLAARADQLVVAADGSAVFGLDLSAGTLTRVAAPGLAVTTSSAGLVACPGDLAFSAGLVWLSDTCTAGTSLVAIDPTSLSVLATTDLGVTPDRLSAGNGVADTLYGWDTSESAAPFHLYRIDVTGGVSPTATVGTSTTSTSKVRAGEVAPDGSALLIADKAGDLIWIDPSTLATSDQVATPGSAPKDLSVRADGVVAFATQGDPVSFYLPGTTQFASAPDYASGYSPLPGAVDFGAQRVYYIAANSAGSYRLGISTPAQSSGISVSTPRTNGYKYNALVQITAQITDPATTTGMSVEIYTQTRVGALQLLTSGVVDNTGTLTASFNVTEYTAIIALFPGDDTFAPALATTHVKSHAKLKTKAVRAKRFDGKYALYRFTKKAVAKVHVSPYHAGSQVYFKWQYYYLGKWHTGSTSKRYAMLDANSNASYGLIGDKSAIGINVRILCYFPGDNRNNQSRGKPVYIRFTK